jgi:hypothetical protein
MLVMLHYARALESTREDGFYIMNPFDPFVVRRSRFDRMLMG